MTVCTIAAWQQVIKSNTAHTVQYITKIEVLYQTANKKPSNRELIRSDVNDDDDVHDCADFETEIRATYDGVYCAPIDPTIRTMYTTMLDSRSTQMRGASECVN